MKGHHAETRRTARNFLIIHTIAVRPINKLYIIICDWGNDIARFDSHRYSDHDSIELFACAQEEAYMNRLMQVKVSAGHVLAALLLCNSSSTYSYFFKDLILILPNF